MDKHDLLIILQLRIWPCRVLLLIGQLECILLSGEVKVQGDVDYFLLFLSVLTYDKKFTLLRNKKVEKRKRKLKLNHWLRWLFSNFCQVSLSVVSLKDRWRENQDDLQEIFWHFQKIKEEKMWNVKWLKFLREHC